MERRIPPRKGLKYKHIEILHVDSSESLGELQNMLIMAYIRWPLEYFAKNVRCI